MHRDIFMSRIEYLVTEMTAELKEKVEKATINLSYSLPIVANAIKDGIDYFTFGEINSDDTLVIVDRLYRKNKDFRHMLVYDSTFILSKLKLMELGFDESNTKDIEKNSEGRIQYAELLEKVGEKNIHTLLSLDDNVMKMMCYIISNNMYTDGLLNKNTLKRYDFPQLLVDYIAIVRGNKLDKEAIVSILSHNRYDASNHGTDTKLSRVYGELNIADELVDCVNEKLRQVDIKVNISKSDVLNYIRRLVYYIESGDSVEPIINKEEEITALIHKYRIDKKWNEYINKSTCVGLIGKKIEENKDITRLFSIIDAEKIRYILSLNLGITDDIIEFIEGLDKCKLDELLNKDAATSVLKSQLRYKTYLRDYLADTEIDMLKSLDSQISDDLIRNTCTEDTQLKNKTIDVIKYIVKEGITNYRLFKEQQEYAVGLLVTNGYLTEEYKYYNTKMLNYIDKSQIINGKLTLKDMLYYFPPYACRYDSRQYELFESLIEYYRVNGYVKNNLCDNVMSLNIDELCITNYNELVNIMPNLTGVGYLSISDIAENHQNIYQNILDAIDNKMSAVEVREMVNNRTK